MTHNGLVLSIFPGMDLLGRAFEEQGYCLVRGPDVLWGGDIRTFHPPAGVFEGVIGGDPCQAHMPMARYITAAGAVHEDYTPEYQRIILETAPLWFVRENTPLAPDLKVQGYTVTRLVINNRWLGAEQNRRRCFWFGTRDGRRLEVEIALFEAPTFHHAVTSGHGGKKYNGEKYRSLAEANSRPLPLLCELQGLPADWFDGTPFTADGKKRVLANGVPLPMGRAIARAVRRAMEV